MTEKVAVELFQVKLESSSSAPAAPMYGILNCAKYNQTYIGSDGSGLGGSRLYYCDGEYGVIKHPYTEEERKYCNTQSEL